MVVSNIFYVHPYLEKIPILTNIFQMGWNHQLGSWNLVKFIVTKTRVFGPRVLGPRKKGSWLRFRDISPKISGKSRWVKYYSIWPFCGRGWNLMTWCCLVATQFIFLNVHPEALGKIPMLTKKRWVETTKQMQMYGEFESYVHLIMPCFGLVIFHDPCHLPHVFFPGESFRVPFVVDGFEIQRSPVEVGSLSHYFQGFIYPRWLFGISEPSTVLRMTDSHGTIVVYLIFLCTWTVKVCLVN